MGVRKRFARDFRDQYEWMHQLQYIWGHDAETHHCQKFPEVAMIPMIRFTAPSVAEMRHPPPPAEFLAQSGVQRKKQSGVRRKKQSGVSRRKKQAGVSEGKNAESAEIAEDSRRAKAQRSPRPRRSQRSQRSPRSQRFVLVLLKERDVD